MIDTFKLKLINDGNHANSEYLAAIMTWPNDQSRVERLTLAGIQNLQDTGGEPSRASIITDVNSEFQKALWPGFVTGKVLIACLTGLSLGKARFLAVKTMNNSNMEGNRRTLSIDTVRNYWRKYKNAAHLWAAYATLEVEGGNKDPNILVQLASQFQRMAIKTCDFDDWVPVSVETDLGEFDGEIKIPPFSQEVLALLDTYIPHSKS